MTIFKILSGIAFVIFLCTTIDTFGDFIRAIVIVGVVFGFIQLLRLREYLSYTIHKEDEERARWK